jgi:hypothetical protein
MKGFVYGLRGMLIVLSLSFAACISIGTPSCSIGGGGGPVEEEDPLPPMVSITSHTNGQEVGSTYVLSGSYSFGEYSGDNVYYNTDGGEWQVAELGSGWSCEISLTEEGMHTNRVYVKDSKGNTSAVGIVVVDALFALYVTTDGENNNSGKKDSPLKNIQDAVTKAGNIGISDINIASGVYTPGSGLNYQYLGYLNSGIFVGTSNLNILGGWDTDFISRDGMSELDGNGELYHIITIGGFDNITVDGFVIRGGDASGGDGPYSGHGSGICVIEGSGHFITNVIITNNTAFYQGGGVYVYKGINHSFGGIISDNSADEGGGVYFYDDTANDTHTFLSPVIEGNTGYGVYRYDDNSNPQGVASVNWGSGNSPDDKNW